MKKVLAPSGSKKFSVNIYDVLKGVIIAIGTPVLFAIQSKLDSGNYQFSTKELLMIGIGGFVTYLIKNFFTTPTTPSK